jgi:predicted amidophosphoribosyltransferase
MSHDYGEPFDPKNDPQWQCSGCGNWWPGLRRLCDLCGKTFWSAKIVRGDCEAGRDTET